MVVLGIECSSRQGSVALLDGDKLLAEKTGIADRIRHNVIFDALEEIRTGSGIQYADISLYAVGRGPGSFSGMRMSFAIAQSLALPDKKEVRAVSSGAALAYRVAQTFLSAHEQTGKSAPQQIAVAGDARRGQIWLGMFHVDAASSPDVQFIDDWKLIPYEEAAIPDGTVVTSPEAERLEKIFPAIGAPEFPHARDVALLAQKISEPPEPLYMHPAVFSEPKYAVEKTV
ncbi:MAG: tRNA (adenosine(37)-N6)-threonylcarbamoyltransferase complex dimerization subunit type 1 TsaB [Kiritimatiellales bacterium]